ncbi:MAG: hypothetical protein QXF43_04010 [Nitrososphaerales archaeon]
MIKVILSEAEFSKTLASELKDCYALLNFERIDSNVAKQLRMIKRKRPGMRLAALGIGVIVLPEPAGLSDVFGVSLLALGALIEKTFDFIGISDVSQEFSNTLKSLASLKSEICC